jgi:putative tricarboxylic transport membrane protein
MQGIAASALIDVLTVGNLLAVVIGVLFGLFVGAIPGLTISLGMVLLLPVTFALPPVTSICLLLGLYTSGMLGGSISAVLLNIPGTPSASATGLDGHQLTLKGRAGLGLGTAVIASFLGGMFGLICLVLVAPVIAHFALKFGAPELFALVLLGLTLICSFGQKSTIKGLIAGLLGLIVMTVGLDPMVGTQRFTFGNVYLQEGVHFLPAMIGLFAIPQIITGIAGRSKVMPGYNAKITGLLPRVRDVVRTLKAVLIGAVTGTAVGAIPGTGGPIAVFLAYDLAKRASKNRDQFGQGDVRGVAAPEAANNAVAGGALIPMLTLGIPGDPITAIMLGALIIHGLVPGPLLFQRSARFVYSLFWAALAANVFTLVLSFLTIKLWVRVLKVPQRFLLPIILILCLVGSYALRNSLFDVGVMLAFGVLGYFMTKYGFPIVPLLLGIILGPALEQNLRLALVISQGDVSVFFTHPISLTFIILAVILFVGPLVSPAIRRRLGALPSAEGCEEESDLNLLGRQPGPAQQSDKH